MNILIVGNGGREHALSWKIKQSKHCGKLFVSPGNAGTSLEAVNIAIGINDFPRLGSFCLENQIELVVVGPEGPLVNGLRDHFEADARLQHILLVGPGRAGAQLEGSKDFSKQFMVRNGIPTAKARTFRADQIGEALNYLKSCTPPIVLKADGLAGGKGVVISPSIAEAQGVLHEMLEEKKFLD